MLSTDHAVVNCLLTFPEFPSYLMIHEFNLLPTPPPPPSTAPDTVSRGGYMENRVSVNAVSNVPRTLVHANVAYTKEGRKFRQKRPSLISQKTINTRDLNGKRPGITLARPVRFSSLLASFYSQQRPGDGQILVSHSTLKGQGSKPVLYRGQVEVQENAN